MGCGTTPDVRYTEKGISYDRNGNLLTLQRYGGNTSPDNDFTYSYTGNKLNSISGPQSAVYAHDNNGNMTSDGLKNLQISYNVANLPETLSQNGTVTATYSWLSDGTKYKTADGNGTRRLYAGSLTYNMTGNGSGITFEGAEISGGEGRIVPEGSTTSPNYYLKDHLGSIRVILNGTGSIIEQNDYYPFGLRTDSGNSYAGINNRYLYNGKEKQTIGGSDFLDYGARMYDPVLCRWTKPDPLMEKYYAYSPYNYCVNDPVKFVDPDGDTVRVYTETHIQGHSWISTGEKDNMTMFTYGRYAGTTGLLSKMDLSVIANGPGVLLKLQGDDIAAYMTEKEETNYSTFNITDVKDEEVYNVLNTAFNASDKIPVEGKYAGMDNARVIDHYNLLSNNCTTKVCDVLNQAGSNILQTTHLQLGVDILYKQRERFILPLNLQIYLNNKLK